MAGFSTDARPWQRASMNSADGDMQAVIFDQGRRGRPGSSRHLNPYLNPYRSCVLCLMCLLEVLSERG